MTETYRSLIDTTLKGMEAGKFQDFCLEFLPIYDKRFNGIARFGHTASGKTRRGTPDLIKTNSDGTQTAIQCGTEEHYWKPTKNYENWKPCEDAQKCIDGLDSLSEIVLISSREQSIKHPNAKADIINHLRNRTTATITPLSLEDISQFISTNIQGHLMKQILEKYFPELFGAISSQDDAQKYRIATEVASQKTIDATTLFEIVKKVFESSTGGEAKKYILERIEDLAFSYRLNPVPPFVGTMRESVNSLPLKKPLGKVWFVLGVPKIGKTSLLLQLMESWNIYDIHWYDCPIESNDCASTIALNIIKTVLPSENPLRLFKSPLILETALKAAKELSKAVLFIIDNANHLPEEGQKQIAQVLTAIKRHELMKNVGVIFTTNKTLWPFLTSIDEELVPPAWSANELGHLLQFQSIQFDIEYPEKYLESLAFFSGGHPLLATALARKHPTLSELVLNSLGTKPSLVDETLSKEVQLLLYNDVLTDADSQNLVQRLSILVGRVPVDILEVLRNDILPQINMSSAIIIEQAGRSLIEGDQNSGYCVSFVFREIAKQKISEQEKQSVYQAVARKFLRPVRRVMNAERSTWGIYYACLSHDFDGAFFWASHLVWNALRSNLTEIQMKALLARLDFLQFIKPNKEFNQQYAHGMAMSMLSIAYAEIGEYKKSVDMLENVTIEISSSDDNPLMQSVPILRFIMLMGKVLSLCMLESPNALKVLCQVDVSALGINISEESEESKELMVNFLDLLSQMILRYPIADLSPLVIHGLIERIKENDLVRRETIIKLANNIGLRAKKDGLTAESLDKFFIGTPLGEIMKHTAKGTLLIEMRQGSRALEEINYAIRIAERNQYTGNGAWTVLHVVKGDAAYQEGNNQLAEEAYEEALTNSQHESFEYGWSSWRLGLIRNDEEKFKQAATAFQGLSYSEMWARATGARGALLVKSGYLPEGIQCFHELIESYFIQKEERTGPAVTIAFSHLFRLQQSLAGNPIPDSEISHPQFIASLYAEVLDSARPNAGVVVAFYSLAETYRLLGNQKKAQACLIKALNSIPEYQLDKEILPIVIKYRLDSLLDSINDRTEMMRCIQLVLKCQSLDIKATLPVLVDIIFSKADTDFRTGMLSERLETILDLLEEALKDEQLHKTFWEGEVLIRRAKLLQAHGGEKYHIVKLYREALDKGRRCQNGSVIIGCAHTLGFEFCEFVGSFNELAQYQLASIEGIECQNKDYDRLTTLGENLFKIWRNISYRRLLESDLITKKYLMDSARDMNQAALPAERAGICMVLLLARLFGHDGTAVDWVKTKLNVQIFDLPAHVSKLLSPIFVEK